MTYYGDNNNVASSSDKTGVLLVNLGSPEKPNCPSLRRYLSEFLLDPRIIELPKLFRWLLVKGIIINARSHKSAATYRQIWTEQGSPLLSNTQALCDSLSEQLSSKFVIQMAMRYGQPSVENGIKALHKKGLRKLIVLPLYPQYSGSTSGSTFDAVADTLKKMRWLPELHFISDYYQNPLYSKAIAESIKQHWRQNGRAEKLLLSFHGVPQKYIDNGDPYQAQCQQSAQAIVEHLDLNDKQWQLVYQSRFGAQQWLQPYCDKTLIELAKQGVRSVDIICPGFSADCLETLEEIKVENRDYFLQNGGQQFNYIGCLNAQASHVQLIADVIQQSSLATP